MAVSGAVSERLGLEGKRMKIRITRKAYKVCRVCRLRRASLRLYIIIHTAEDGY